MVEQLRIAIPVLWPAMAVAGAMMLVAWWPRCDMSGAPLVQRERGWAGALAFGLAFVAAFLRLVVREQAPFLPLRERWQWLLPMGVAATLLGVAAGYSPRSATARWMIALATALAAGLIFRPLESVGSGLILRLGVAVGVLVAWICLEASARRHRGFLTPLLLSMMFTGASLVILHAGNANISLLAAAVAASLGIVAVVAVIMPPLCLAAGATHVLATLLMALLATAWMYRIGDPIALALIAAAPVTLRAGEMLFGRTDGWKPHALRFVAAAVPIALAIALAMSAASGDPAP
jgi:hypothetical protein